MIQQPEKDVAAMLQAAGLGTTSSAPGPQTLAWGPPVSPSQPGAAALRLFVFSTGGRKPTGTFNGGREWSVQLQVRVRSNADDFAGGQALARQVRDALNCTVPAGYVGVTCDTSDPLYLGAAEERHEWSVPLEVLWTT